MTDLDAAIHEVERRLQYFSVAAQIEATMRVGFGTLSQKNTQPSFFLKNDECRNTDLQGT